VTLYDLKVPGRLRYRLAASIASALQVTRMDTSYSPARSGGWQDVAANLDKIITALEAGGEEQEAAADAS